MTGARRRRPVVRGTARLLLAAQAFEALAAGKPEAERRRIAADVMNLLLDSERARR